MTEAAKADVPGNPVVDRPAAGAAGTGMRGVGVRCDRISLQRASIRRTVTPNDPGIGGMSVHQGSDRPARYSTKAILAALADACIDHATDLNFSLHAPEGATEEIVDWTVEPTMPSRQG